MLESNKLNNIREIPYVRTGWEDEITNLGKFDIIIGSNFLYERDHTNLLASFINQHTNRHCKIILIDPGRKHHPCFCKNMTSLGYSHSQRKPENIDHLAQPIRGIYRCQILSYNR